MVSGGQRTGAGRKPSPNPLIRRAIRFTDEEWSQLKTLAESAGMNASEYIRNKVLREENKMTNQIEKLEKRYGSVEFEGKKYILADQAEPTSRLLPYPANYNDVETDEEYDFEMSAEAIDTEGNEYTVYWIFTDVKGENGKELDSFDYDKVDRVKSK